MDPISQGAVGAAFAQTAARREQLRAYAIFGALAGMAPDLDVLIQSSTDPLLFLEYHRHFTHALVFIPIGALIVCGALFKLWRHPLTFRQAYIACLLGYATHGLLDACTSYGTQLLWPFSDVRIAWNNVSVVDPLATIPLLILLVMATWRRNIKYVFAGVIWLVAYLLLGVLQNDRAMDAARSAAQQRGHQPERLTVKPGFANLILWKSIYEHAGRYYVDAVRVTSQAQFCPGTSIAKLQPPGDLPFLQPGSQQARDLERFRWFSDDYLAAFEQPTFIIDIRYATVPNDIYPLWGIHMNPAAAADDHVRFEATPRATPEQTAALTALLLGYGCEPI